MTFDVTSAQPAQSGPDRVTAALRLCCFEMIRAMPDEGVEEMKARLVEIWKFHHDRKLTAPR